MDAIVQALLTQGAVGVVAALALFLLDKSYKDRIKEYQQYVDGAKADRQELIIVIRENAKIITALQISIETGQRSLEALIYDRSDPRRSFGKPPDS